MVFWAPPRGFTKKFRKSDHQLEGEADLSSQGADAPRQRVQDARESGRVAGPTWFENLCLGVIKLQLPDAGNWISLPPEVLKRPRCSCGKEAPFGVPQWKEGSRFPRRKTGSRGERDRGTPNHVGASARSRESSRRPPHGLRASVPVSELPGSRRGNRELQPPDARKRGLLSARKAFHPAATAGWKAPTFARPDITSSREGWRVCGTSHE